MNKMIDKETFYLKDILLSSLPQNFHTTKSLDCNDTTLTSLPDGLEVGGDLILGNSNICKLPQKLIVGGNIITTVFSSLEIPKDALIGGKIITTIATLEPPFQSQYWVKADDGMGIYCKEPLKLVSEKNYFLDFWYPEITFYQNINHKSKWHICSYKENNNQYFLVCTGMKNAKDTVDWHRARLKGIDKYKDYDIYEPRSVSELIEIYSVCTGTCHSGVEKFLKVFNIDKNKKYSIYEVREMILNLPFESGSSKKIFIDFFEPKEEI